MTPIAFLEKIKKLQAIADVGLLYAKNEYDQERYRELRHISLELIQETSGYNGDQLRAVFPLTADYPTAKVDIRGLILSPDQKILLVQESADGRWSLPGGWADVGWSPKEVIVKEVKEETGLDVIPTQLLAVFDKRLHPHPPQAFYVYKLVFLCEAVSFSIHKGFDVMDINYFAVDALPPLSEDRILESQIRLLISKAQSSDKEPYCD